MVSFSLHSSLSFFQSFWYNFSQPAITMFLFCFTISDLLMRQSLSYSLLPSFKRLSFIRNGLLFPSDFSFSYKTSDETQSPWLLKSPSWRSNQFFIFIFWETERIFFGMDRMEWTFIEEFTFEIFYFENFKGYIIYQF